MEAEAGHTEPGGFPVASRVVPIRLGGKFDRINRIYWIKKEDRMLPINRQLTIPLCYVFLVLATTSANAQEAPPEETKAQAFEVHTMPAPSPSLKYRLTWRFVERCPGNAALRYSALAAEHERDVAALLRNRQESRSEEPIEYDREVGEWMELPLEEFPVEKAKAFLKQYGPITRRLEEATRMEKCDWEHPVHTQGVVSILLPEIQYLRQFARLLALETRIAIVEKRYDDAVRGIKTIIELGRHAASPPILISKLVGTAIIGIGLEELALLSQQPDAPNLYWALATLPRPLVDYRPAYETEQDMLYSMMPPLFDLEKNPPQGRQEWANFLRTFSDRMQQIQGGHRPDLPNVVIAGLVISQYPRAKEGLAAAGFSSRQIAEMSVCEAVSRHAIGDFVRTRDDLFRWMTLQYPEAKPFLDREDQKLQKRSRASAGMFVAALLLPAITHCRDAEIRVDRRANMLLIVHAVREYAATHEGALPQTIGEMKDVIILDDPATGEPFGYRVEDGKAIIEADISKNRPRSFEPNRYEVRIVGEASSSDAEDSRK